MTARSISSRFETMDRSAPVWVLTAGGAIFAAFPNVYATVFSGFYLALVLLLALPLLGLLLRVPPRELVAQLGEPVVLQALRLSLYTSVSAAFAAALLGLPAAWLLASRRFRGKRVVLNFIFTRCPVATMCPAATPWPRPTSTR